jgi:ribosomal protein S4
MSTKIIWRKMRLYKKFELDVWGFHYLAPRHSNQVSRMFIQLKKDRRAYYLSKKMRFVYDLRYIKPPKRRKRFPTKFLSRKFTKLFYLTLSFAQFRKLAKLAGRMEGSFESNYIRLVECRLLTLLYRMHWLYSVFQIRHFIFNKNVLVNNRVVTLCNFAINFGDIVRLRDPLMVSRVRFDIIRRFSRRMLLFNVPRFLYVNYKFMFGTLVQEPKKRDLAYTQKVMDIYRGADVY